MTNAAYWYSYLGAKYPDKPLLDRQPNSLPANLTLQEYAVAQIQQDIDNPNSQVAIRARLGDLLIRAYWAIIRGQPDRALIYNGLAESVRRGYEQRMASATNRVPMPTISELKRDAVRQLVSSYPTEVQPAVWEKLGLEPEPAPVPASTNAAPGRASSP